MSFEVNTVSNNYYIENELADNQEVNTMPSSANKSSSTISTNSDMQGVSQNYMQFALDNDTTDNVGLEETNLSQNKVSTPEKIYYGDIDTEAKLQEFINGGYTKIVGSLKIHNSAMENLDGLEKLTSVAENVEIFGNDNLNDINGLKNLNDIGGNLIIKQNYKLSDGVDDSGDLSALQNLSKIEGMLYIASSNIKSLNGLNNITEVGGPFVLENDYGLTDLTGLENLQKVGSLSISDCHALESFDGSNFKTIAGDVYICQNEKLANWDALKQSLEEVGGNWFVKNNGVNPTKDEIIPKVFIGDVDTEEKLQEFINGGYTKIDGSLKIHNSSMENLDGLEKLTSVTQNVEIFGNTNLNDINGLKNLTEIGGNLIIKQNYKLSDGVDDSGDLSALQNLSKIEGMLYIASSNIKSLNGLNNITEVGGPFILENDYGLTDLIGLENLQKVGSLSISNCHALESFEGSNFKTITGDVSVYQNGKLTDWDALKQSLEEVSGNWFVNNNGVNPTKEEIMTP